MMTALMMGKEEVEYTLDYSSDKKHVQTHRVLSYRIIIRRSNKKEFYMIGSKTYPFLTLKHLHNFCLILFQRIRTDRQLIMD